MLFSSNIFLFLFLPFTLCIYFLIHPRLKNLFLLIMSLIFYAWGEPKFVLVMIFSIIFNYGIALAIDYFRLKRTLAKVLLGFCVAVNLGTLIVYKYLDFLITNLNVFNLNIPLFNLALPIGISFFTFQAMSYVIDVYRGTVMVQKKIQNVGLYISFFPQLIAGPIVRYETIEHQIENRNVNFDLFSEGVRRFIIGFSKKILLANTMAQIADKAFDMPTSELSVAYAWIGALAYSFQILFDFSGYSDMAIGLGKMFGFEFLENFDYPYLSRSISEFWRRWHISLGQWFRDYVYFPLGGSRVKKKSRLVFNLFVVWILTGAWHGASWNFILWGLLYFVLITFEKLTGYPDSFNTNWGKELYHIFTLLAVLGGWVLFRSSGAKAASEYLLVMLGLKGNGAICVNVLYAFRESWFFMLFSVLCSTNIFKILSRRLADMGKISCFILNSASIGLYLFCFIWSVSYIILGAHNPFIYFNF